MAENLDPLRRLEPLCYNNKDDWSRIMNAKIKALSEQARRLSPEERIELIEDLLGSIEPVDPEIDRLWAEEARDRLAAFLSGEMTARTLQEIVQKYQKP